MQVANSGFLVKTNVAVSSAIRNTSCSRGWLRLVVQTIFGLITVSSFIMIMIMALQRKPQEVVGGNRRCFATSCRVTCSGTPSYEDFVNDIIYILSKIEPICGSGTHLTLHRPRFINSTIPKHWLSEVQSRVTKLNIVGGNFRYIEPDAFLSTFASNIQHLVFDDIELAELGSHCFVGLSSLLILDIRNSKIGDIKRNSLRAVDNTLKALYVRNCKYWNPANVTGSSELTSLLRVDLSSNSFFSILGRESFRQLEECEELRLSSCCIISIGPSTFDFMVRVRRIYLNNNYLVTLPVDIFDRVSALAYPRPSIDLQDNLWRCDCYNEHLRRLQVNNFLMVDPTCRTPYEVSGRLFSSFKTFCCENPSCSQEITSLSVLNSSNTPNDLFYNGNIRSTDSLYIDGGCDSGRHFGILNDYRCVSNRVRHIDYDVLVNITREAPPNSEHMVPSFFVENAAASLLELETNAYTGYDLFWYQTNCLTEIYCVNDVPKYLRIYNVNLNSTYVFCAVEQTTGAMVANNCITYIPSFFKNRPSMRLLYSRILVYVTTITLSLIIGGSCLYTIIRRNPTLLRGSKRILLVKHKAVDALVLPPKVPLRRLISRDNSFNNYIGNWKVTNNIMRTNSISSGKSNSPSYISALQPTEAQLAEWRLKHHFNNDLSLGSLNHPNDSNLVSYIYDGDSIYYPADKMDSLDDNCVKKPLE